MSENFFLQSVAFVFLVSQWNYTVTGQTLSAPKQQALKDIQDLSAEMTKMSDQIWAFAELAFQEKKSAQVLIDFARKEGFRVQSEAYDIPTAFVAEYGSGRPIIGILGEFDALPGLSQQARPEKNPVLVGAPGHGCGHNLFGVGSLAAATAIKRMIDQGALRGTIRFYGTPAEEKYFGKVFMAKAGAFADLDVCLDWHPGATNAANTQTSRALVDFNVDFYGKTAHASLDPWNGYSAVDALEFFTSGINYLREHVKPSLRMHYQILHAGEAANIVPDHASLWVRVRDVTREGMLPVYERVKRIAQGAAIMAEVDYKITLISGLHELLVNRTGAEILHKNMSLIGPINYSEEEINYAKEIQRQTGHPQEGLDGRIQPLTPTLPDPAGASTDVGDVSWIVPEISLSATTGALGSPWHSWAVTACGGMSIGHKGMIFAAKSLALTMIDLYQDEQLVQAIKTEFRNRKGSYIYQPILGDLEPWKG